QTSSKIIGIIVGSVVAALVTIASFVGYFIYRKRQKQLNHIIQYEQQDRGSDRDEIKVLVDDNNNIKVLVDGNNDINRNNGNSKSSINSNGSKDCEGQKEEIATTQKEEATTTQEEEATTTQ